MQDRQTTENTGNDRVHRQLELIYRNWHHRRFVYPDPLEVVLSYEKHRDREVAAFICTSLALGRVGSIIDACHKVLSVIGPPSSIGSLPASRIRKKLNGFRYRFFDSEEIVRYLTATGHVLREFGTLEAAFAEGLNDNRQAPLLRRGLNGLVRALKSYEDPPRSIIVADPTKTSAAKRLHLFARWMVRHDCIDPGGWDVIKPVDLLVPVDVHMHRVAMKMGLTVRRSPDLNASEEITAALRNVDALDPVRFDFSMTRLGIHPDGSLTLADLPLGDTHSPGDGTPAGNLQSSHDNSTPLVDLRLSRTTTGKSRKPAQDHCRYEEK